jgi:hypothetical protein
MPTSSCFRTVGLEASASPSRVLCIPAPRSLLVNASTPNKGLNTHPQIYIRGSQKPIFGVMVFDCVTLPLVMYVGGYLDSVWTLLSVSFPIE